ncbi:MAG: FAD-dependent oxidoreductase [Candidatus Omnitrophota bacterium]|nr:MAG: FAD-dependent oxidoreductase [Candidatus Omnitrophota bacterium]
MQFETEVRDIIQRTPNVKSFRFKLNKDVDFKPGQFFFVSIKIGGKEQTKHFSFSNSPTEKGYVEFTKRITESEFSKALEGLKVGDWAQLKMPYGSFTFTGEYEKIAFLSGGIGITPIRSICKFVADKRIPSDIILLYGNNKEEDIIFREDLDGISRSNKNIRIVYTLTQPLRAGAGLTSEDIDRKKWPGRVGLIDDKVIKEEVGDYKERVFYICGPPGMVSSLTGILKNKLGLPEGKIKAENFTGY